MHDRMLPIFLNTENVRLLFLPERSPDLSPIENVWSFVAEQMAHQHMPVTTVDEVWHLGEAEVIDACFLLCMFLNFSKF